MKKLLSLVLTFTCTFFVSYGQLLSFSLEESPPEGRLVTFDVSKLNQSTSLNTGKTSRVSTGLETAFPMPDGSNKSFSINEVQISQKPIESVKTFEATSDNGKAKMRLTVSEGNRMTGIMHTPEGYFYIEPVKDKQDRFLIHSMSDTLRKKFDCIALDEHIHDLPGLNKSRVASVAPFPVGSQLRTYRMAAAATGEFIVHYGSRAAALARIVEVVNAANLIYELEASIRFQLITATTSHTILFPNPNTDPFFNSSGFANATESQNAFTSMHVSGILNYGEYDVGHTFSVYPPIANSYSCRGQAGPLPCQDTAKSRGWTEWSGNALSFSGGLSLVVGVFVHEVAHQFFAPHTFNAAGGSLGSPTFCAAGWSSTSAVEPGGGSTLMGNENNCNYPVNYVLTGSNNLSYFHTKSLEFIYNTVNTYGSCASIASTGNNPPVANAGPDIVIPKGTPFSLTGSASDQDGDLLSYTWEQYDVATANDMGALGGIINGVGGYSAVNSVTAPLFRSFQSVSTTTRFFPDLAHVINSANHPPANAGEALPQVARNMKFRFTVRDNHAGSGGVDSDEVVVTVSNAGPFVINSFNTPQTIAAGSTQTINWSVNGTNSIASNVRISLSIDGGNSFNYVLNSSIPNDGSQSVTIPANVPVTNNARIKISAALGATAEFFDINNGSITITSFCIAQSSIICSDSPVSGLGGSGIFNLGLSKVYGEQFSLNAKRFSFAGSTALPIVNYTDNSMSSCQVQTWTPQAKIVRFRVTSPGNYAIRADGGSGLSFAAVSIHNSAALNCGSLVSANSHGAVAWFASQSVVLEACVTYYAVVYNLQSESEFNLSILGPGNSIEVLDDPPGYNYTYVAVSLSDNRIKAVSAASNFISLEAGNYEIFGLSYSNSFTLTALNEKTISEALGLGSCILFSSNSKRLNITGNSPCPPTLVLVSSSKEVPKKTAVASSQIKLKTAQNVKHQSLNLIVLEPQKDTSFEVKNGNLYLTEKKNCK